MAFVSHMYIIVSSCCEKSSPEGVNGTLSAPSPLDLKEYIDRVQAFDLVKDCGLPPDLLGTSDQVSGQNHFLFADVDWKKSSCDSKNEPFPDLKVAVVKEISVFLGSSFFE